MEVAKALLDANANMEATNNDGYRPLHWAALWGMVEVTKALLDAKADTKAASSAASPIQLACRHPEVERLLEAAALDKSESG